MSAKALSAGLIGCGAISKLHVRSMLAAGLEVAAVCDTDPAAAERLKSECQVPRAAVYTDFRELLKHDGLAVVGIATPPFLHKEQILASLGAGLWVYSEKPVAETLEGIEEIAEAERRTGRRAWYTPARFRGGVGILAKRHIDDGELGDLYRVHISHFRQRGRPGVDMAGTARWFADSRKAITGITGDMGLYFFDQALYLTGWPAVVAVSAMTYKEFPFEMPEGLPYDVEEHVLILARTAGKLVLTFEFANIAHHPWSTSLMILGTKGGILNDDEKKFRFLTEKGGPGKSVTQTEDGKDEEGQDTRAYKAIAACARGDMRDAATTTPEVQRLHELAQMAFLSAKERREVRPADLDRKNHILWNERPRAARPA